MIVFSEYRPFWVEEHLRQFLELSGSEVVLWRSGCDTRLFSLDQICLLDDFRKQSNESEGFWCLHGPEILSDSNEELLKFHIFEFTSLHQIERFLSSLEKKYSWTVFPWKGDRYGEAEVLGFISQDTNVANAYLNTLNYSLFDEQMQKEDKNRAALISKWDLINEENFQFNTLIFKEKASIGYSLWKNFGLNFELPFVATIDIEHKNFGRKHLQGLCKKLSTLCSGDIALHDGDSEIVPNYCLYEIGDSDSFDNFVKYYNSESFTFFVPSDSQPENVKKIMQILLKGSSEASFEACANSILNYVDWIFFPAETDVEESVSYLMCRDNTKLRTIADLDEVVVKALL